MSYVLYLYKTATLLSRGRKNLTNIKLENTIMKYQINSLSLDDIATALYRLNTTHFSPAIIACFMMNDDWNEQSLIELKEKTDAYLLVGLQTENSDFNGLDILDGVIKCRLSEVEEVIKLLDIESATTLIGIDVVDIHSLFKCSKSFKFIQTNATGYSQSDLIKATTQQLVSQLSDASDIKGLFINIDSNESLALDDFSYIAETIESLPFYSDIEIYYSHSITDEPNYFQLRAIYAEVEGVSR